MGIRAAGDCGRANIRLLPAHVAANRLNRPRTPSTEKTSLPVSRPWPTGYNLVSHQLRALRKVEMYLIRLYLSLVKMGHTCSMRMVHLYLADGTFVPSGSLAPNRHGAKGPGCTWIVCDVDHLRSDFRTVSKPGYGKAAAQRGKRAHRFRASRRAKRQRGSSTGPRAPATPWDSHKIPQIRKDEVPECSAMLKRCLLCLQFYFALFSATHYALTVVPVVIE